MNNLGKMLAALLVATASLTVAAPMATALPPGNCLIDDTNPNRIVPPAVDAPEVRSGSLDADASTTTDNPKDIYQLVGWVVGDEVSLNTGSTAASVSMSIYFFDANLDTCSAVASDVTSYTFEATAPGTIFVVLTIDAGATGAYEFQRDALV